MAFRKMFHIWSIVTVITLVPVLYHVTNLYDFIYLQNQFGATRKYLYHNSTLDTDQTEITNGTYGRVVHGKSHVIFNPLPKTGSRTLNTIAHKVAVNRGARVEDTMALSNETIHHKIERLLRDGGPTFIYTHTPYYTLPITGIERSKPVYVSIVRDPIERLVSLYYFKVFGDSTKPGRFRAEMEDKNFTKDTFDECFRRRGECVDRTVRSKTVQQFCGRYTSSSSQRFPPAKACLRRSKWNLRNRYLVVGVMEDYDGFLAVLERLLPDMFEGAVDYYSKLKREGSFKKTETKNKTGPADWVRRRLRKMLEVEYEMYNFIREEFETLKHDLGL